MTVFCIIDYVIAIALKGMVRCQATDCSMRIAICCGEESAGARRVVDVGPLRSMSGTCEPESVMTVDPRLREGFLKDL